MVSGYGRCFGLRLGWAVSLVGARAGCRRQVFQPAADHTADLVQALGHEEELLLADPVAVAYEAPEDAQFLEVQVDTAQGPRFLRRGRAEGGDDEFARWSLVNRRRAQSARRSRKAVFTAAY